MRGYVITESAPRDAFRAAAAAAGLSLAKEFPAEGLRPYQEAWANEARSVVAQYVDETALELQYFFLRGDATLRAHVMSALVQRLAYENREQIVEAAGGAASEDARVTSCNRLAVAETDFDREVLDLLARFAADASETVRTAAARSLGYLRWAEARPVLETLERDASEWVRNAARVALAELR